MMNRPSFKEALLFWFKLGFISFGGPAGQISIMHEFLVEKKRWISDSKFLDALNYSMILPGPEAQQLATYIGWMIHGTRGGLAAGILFVMPSMFILLGLSMIYVRYGNLPWVYAMFDGLKPAIIAIVVLALIKIGKKALLSPFHYLVAVAAFVGIFFFNIAFPIIIISAIAIAILCRHTFPALLYINSSVSEEIDHNERNYFINKYTISRGGKFNFLRFFIQLGSGILLWIMPLFFFYYVTSDFTFWKTLSLFFTKAAFVTFGGAYAVLPYVAQVSVEQFDWLTKLQMIDGLALGETTPGPLVMVLVFVGFMAGYNHYSGSLVMGTMGLLVTTFYTFLPCFLFILKGGPIIERTKDNKVIREILSLVTASVVGVILNLSLYLGQAVLLPDSYTVDGLDYLTLSWVVISFVAMYRFKVSMIIWIAVSAIFGLVYHFLLA